MTDHAQQADVLGLTAQIVSAHVSNNSVTPDALSALIQDVYRTLSGVGKEPAAARQAAACRSGQEIGLPRPHRLSGGRQEAEDAEAASEDRLQHDAGAVPRALGPGRPTIRWWRRTTPAIAPRWPRRSGSAPSRAAASSAPARSRSGPDARRLAGLPAVAFALWPASPVTSAGEDGTRAGLAAAPAAERPGCRASLTGRARRALGERWKAASSVCASRRGLKMTGQRRVIARVLSEAADHPDVEELYRRATALDPRISIATVYRTVRLLEEHGILERRDFGGGRARYEPTEHGHHHHLIDVDTGRVIEFEDAEHERVLQAIAARLGFDLVSHRLELFGRRRDARAPAQPGQARGRARREPRGVRRGGAMTATTPVGRRGAAAPPTRSSRLRRAARRQSRRADRHHARPRSMPCRRCATACSTRRWARVPDADDRAQPARSRRASTRSPTICWWSIMRSGRGRRAWSAPIG